MTTFSITGKRRASTGTGAVDRTVTWTDGALSGDADEVEVVQRLAKAYDGRPLKALTGGESTTDHLQNPPVACMLIKSIFLPRTTTQIGSLPKIKLPPGAIA